MLRAEWQQHSKSSVDCPSKEPAISLILYQKIISVIKGTNKHNNWNQLRSEPEAFFEKCRQIVKMTWQMTNSLVWDSHSVTNRYHEVLRCTVILSAVSQISQNLAYLSLHWWHINVTIYIQCKLHQLLSTGSTDSEPKVVTTRWQHKHTLCWIGLTQLSIHHIRQIHSTNQCSNNSRVSAAFHQLEYIQCNTHSKPCTQIMTKQANNI